MQAAIHGGLEGVAGGPEFDVGIGFKGLAQSSRSASSASNDAYLDGLVIPGLSFCDMGHSHRGQGAGCGGGLEDLAAGSGVWHER